MKKARIFLLLTFFIPSITSASISLEINNLLQELFNPTENKPTPASPLEILNTVEIPNITTPENPTEQDLIEFQNKISAEEQALQQFEKQVVDTEAVLYELEDQKQNLQTKLALFDAERSQNQQALQDIEPQSETWKKRLKEVTTKADKLRREIRIRQTDLNTKLNKKFAQEKNNSDQEIPWLGWVLSQKKLSQVLDEKSRLQQQLQPRLSTAQNSAI